MLCQKYLVCKFLQCSICTSSSWPCIDSVSKFISSLGPERS